MEPISLSKFAAAVIASVVSAGQAPERLQTDRHHLQGVVSSVSSAVSDGGEMPFDGPGAQELAVVTLAVTAWKETNMLRKYSDCTVKGDKGASITAYMLMKPWALQRLDRTTVDRRGRPIMKWTDHHTEAEICADRVLASKQALHIITNFQRMNKWASPSEVFQGYVSGSYASRLSSAYGRCYMWQRQAKAFGLRDNRGAKVKDVTCFTRPKDIVVDEKVRDAMVKKWSGHLSTEETR